MHVEHRRILSLTSTSACARSRAYSPGARKMWKARREAVFSPMPGSLASSRMSREIGSVAKLEQAGDVEAARHRRDGACLQLLRFDDRLVDGGDDEILQHRRIFGIDARGIDLDRLDLEAAGDGDRYHAAAGRGCDGLLLGLLL